MYIYHLFHLCYSVQSQYATYHRLFLGLFNSLQALLHTLQVQIVLGPVYLRHRVLLLSIPQPPRQLDWGHETSLGYMCSGIWGSHRPRERCPSQTWGEMAPTWLANC